MNSDEACVHGRKAGRGRILSEILKFEVFFQLVFHEILILLAGCRASKSGREVLKGRS